MSTAIGRVLTSDPTYSSGKAAELRLDAAGRLMTTSNVTVVSEGTGTATDDAADVTLNNGSETSIAAADSARRTLFVTSLSTNTVEIRLGKTGQVGASRGLPLQPGQTAYLDTTAALYGYAAAASQKVAVFSLKD